ncbi:SGNH/GDSL hydrolase family protein [Fulvivirga ligni]|uniref:SGNH/GDSL hydrolase family protein n=1 Tax=Fulvivirga ligni TaxID=2904246 RepID=UPI001F40139E|nr:SGNH/GDSL hydrolase family protein [Fulvivirga ligni]UII19545.1 SGNH/GDSL hydrolase family protein [Fulvivirga ligni]
MRRIGFTVIILLGFSWSLLAQTVKPFKEGEKVAFVGNSITEAGFYEEYIWLYYMTHFPDRRIEVINVGIGGDVSRQIDARIESDAFALNPTVVVVTFGMNDSGYHEYNGDNPQQFADDKVKESNKYFQEIIKKLKAKPNVEKIIMSTSPYDETMKNEQNYFPGKSKTIERIVAFQKEEAAKYNWPFVDLYYPMQAINTEGQKTNPEFTITGPDRIHPGNGGHLVMAYLFLKAQGLEAPVAEVSIDLKKGKVLQENNAKISNLQASKSSITFDYLAKSLPYPVDSSSRMWGNDQKMNLALDVVPFTQDFNREMLKLENLKAGKYQLLIDGDSIGIWDAQALNNGINLALQQNTPQYRQAWTVGHLANSIRDIDNKLREYYWIQFDFFLEHGMLFQNDDEAVEFARKQSENNFWLKSKMDTYEAMRFESIRKTYYDQKEALADLIYKLNKPKTHNFKIVPVAQ